MTEYFAKPTYILSVLPETITGKVNAIRKHFDPVRSTLDAEISLTGSSGVGPLAAQQSAQRVFEEIDRIAGMTEAFTSRFRGVGSFPGTGIYFFTLENEMMFRRLHQLFCDADIYYRPTTFPFLPHCTITLLENPPPPDIAAQIMALPVPREEFPIDNISVYSVDEHGQNPELLHRAELKKVPEHAEVGAAN